MSEPKKILLKDGGKVARNTPIESEKFILGTKKNGMKRQSIKFNSISLGLILLLWFCMAFACKTSDIGEPAQRETTRAQNGSPSEADVRDAIQKWLEASETQYDQNSTTDVELDSAVKVAAPTERYTTKTGNKTFYPVKINYTATVESPSHVTVTHYSGGRYDFYQDDFGEWLFVLGEDYKITRDNALSREKF